MRTGRISGSALGWRAVRRCCDLPWRTAEGSSGLGAALAGRLLDRVRYSARHDPWGHAGAELWRCLAGLISRPPAQVAPTITGGYFYPLDEGDGSEASGGLGRICTRSQQPHPRASFFSHSSPVDALIDVILGCRMWPPARLSGRYAPD